MLGATCTNRMRQVDAPVTRAASTKARSRTVSTCERITRAVFGQSSSAMARTTFQVRGPRKPASTMTKGRNGMPSATSASRISTRVDPAAEIAGDEPDQVPISATTTAAVSPT